MGTGNNVLGVVNFSSRTVPQRQILDGLYLPRALKPGSIPATSAVSTIMSCHGDKMQDSCPLGLKAHRGRER